MAFLNIYLLNYQAHVQSSAFSQAVEFNCSCSVCVEVWMFVLKANVFNLNVPTKSSGETAYNMVN